MPVPVEVGPGDGEEKGPPRVSMVSVKVRLNVPYRVPNLGGSLSVSSLSSA